MSGQSKMFRCRWACAVIVAGLAAMVLDRQRLVAAEDSTEARVEEHVAELIDRLGSTSFEEREAAEKKLTEIGKPARVQLAASRNHPSAEVRSRVAKILRQMRELPLNDAFRVMAQQPDEKLDVEEGMWLISRILNPDLPREALTKQLDALAGKVRKRLGETVPPRDTDPEQIIAALREVLFQEQGFGGNVDDYQNPANSSLEKVLDTRKGLPILVSHVVVAVARRLDVPIVGVPTPGRYIVKYDGQRAPAGFAKQDVYLDPFDNGKLLSREDRRRLFPGIDPDLMVPSGSNRDVLIRMLNNIETHLFGKDESDLAYLAVEFRVALQQPVKQP